MIRYEEKIPTAEEYNYLYENVGWGSRDENIIIEALKNSIYCLCVYDDEKIVGFGRLIGDKTIFVYIQDIMVAKKFQKKHIGTNIMNKIIEKIEELKKANPNLRVYLGADVGKESFYERFGFITREEAGLGRGMILK